MQILSLDIHIEDKSPDALVPDDQGLEHDFRMELSMYETR